MKIHAIDLHAVPSELRDTKDIKLNRDCDFTATEIALPEVKIAGNLDISLGGFTFSVNVNADLLDTETLIKLLQDENTNVIKKPNQPIRNLLLLLEMLSRQDVSLYQAKDNEPLSQTLARYHWDQRLSHAMMKVLRSFELCLSHQLDKLFCELYGEDWITNPPKILEIDDRSTRNKVERIIENLEDELKRKPTQREIAAKLNLGFWVAFFQNKYEFSLWRQKGMLAKVFPNLPTDKLIRSDIFERLKRIKWLRNRAVHHDPIWNNKIPAINTYSECRFLLGAINTDALSDSDSTDQVVGIWNERVT